MAKNRIAPTTAMLAEEIEFAARIHGASSLIVLSGVPATGKTHLSRLVAERLAGHERFIREVQFHSGYTYEDFIQGLRPNERGGYFWQSGVLLAHSEDADADENKAQRYVLIIEELTRANIAAVLGELLTYVEYRGPRARAFTLPSGQTVALSDRLVILATMNPRDRSALEMDDALIRRLRIVDCPPSTAQLREMLSGVAPKLVNGLVGFFGQLEDEMDDEFETAMPFGHGVFKGIASESDLHLLWKQRIRHILRGPNGPRHAMTELIEEAWAKFFPEVQEKYAPDAAEEQPLETAPDPFPSGILSTETVSSSAVPAEASGDQLLEESRAE